MAALHNVPWEPRRDAWGEPFALSEELKRLDYLLDRPTLDPAVVARAPELRERLRSSLPTGARIGCVHGDFQWSNVLFNEERVVALIDWEISLVGATLLDLGWICFFSDPGSWVGTALIRAAARCSTPTKSSRRTPRPPASPSRFPKCDGSAPSRAIASA